LGADYTNGISTGRVSSGCEVNLGYKPRFIYLFYSTGSGDYYWNYYIYYIPCYNSSKGYMACYRNKTGSSEQAGAKAHQEVTIADYITLTDTGFIAKKDYTYEIAY